MKNHPLSLSLSAAACFIAASIGAMAEDARSIFEKFEAQKADALAAYLKENPGAEDARMAESMLISSYQQLGQAEKAAPLLRARYDALEKGENAVLQELIPEVIQPLFQIYASNGMKDEAQAFLEQAKADLSKHPQGNQIAQFFDGMLAELAKPSVGDSMDISFVATDGTEVNVAKLSESGKVVLVDFWATWCGPCVAELPHVLSAYEKYHEKGFEVVAISLDEDKAALDNFVKQRGLPWPQFFDGKGWQNDFAQKNGITGIPATFLIGKDGKVVATDLRGDMLEQQLEKLLGES